MTPDPQMPPFLLDHFGARRWQRCTIVLQHINVFSEHNGTNTATIEIADALDGIKHPRGLQPRS